MNNDTIIRMNFTIEEMRRYSYYLDIAIKHIERDQTFTELLEKYNYHPIQILSELKDRFTT